MNGDVSKVGMNRLTLSLEAEVVTVNLRATAIRKQSLPVAGMNLYLLYIITFRVDKRGDAFCAPHAHIMFRAIAPTNYCNCLLHILLFDVILFLHLFSNASISSGSSDEKNISFSVTGCTKPSVFA